MKLVDSHTGGEPTRVLVAGCPDLSGTTMAEKQRALERHWDYLRTAITAEPRASEGTVAAFLTEPVRAGSLAGVIFANRERYIGMCGHGAIGVARTLLHAGRLERERKEFSLDTPAGTIHVQLLDTGVQIQNVASYAHALNATLNLPELGSITGDVAYGGNWFFLTDVSQRALRHFRVTPGEIPKLTLLASDIRRQLRAQGITGADGVEIDHVEIFGPAQHGNADAKNFVLCPDGAHDRSPCGTGTSAKMAVQAARNLLAPGQMWRQESIIGSIFAGCFNHRTAGGAIIPFIRGSAYITAESVLHFDANDPFRFGIPAMSCSPHA